MRSVFCTGRSFIIPSIDILTSQYIKMSCLSIYLPIHHHIDLSVNTLLHQPIVPSINRVIYQLTIQTTDKSMSVNMPIKPPLYILISIVIDLSVDLSVSIYQLSYLSFYVPIYISIFLQQSASWKAKSCPAGQKISCLLTSFKFLYHVHSSLTLY